MSTYVGIRYRNGWPVYVQVWPSDRSYHDWMQLVLVSRAKRANDVSQGGEVDLLH